MRLRYATDSLGDQLKPANGVAQDVILIYPAFS